MSNYWQERAQQRLISAEERAIRFEKQLKKSFDKVYRNIESEIANMYFRYAEEQGIEYSEVKKKLTKAEKEQFRRDMELKYESAGTQAEKDRIKGYYQTAVNRLEAKKANVRAEVDRLYAEEFSGEFQTVMDEIYRDNYYKTIFDTQVMLGFGIEFDRVSRETLQSLLDYPWSGKNYSEKLWAHVQSFSSKLEEVLTAGIIQGKSNQEMARSLAKACDAQYKNALRLVRTETNFIANEATAKAYKSQGIEEYQYLAALDLRTSEICREMDRSVFKLEDKKIGVNYPPLHPHCRSTTVPYFPYLEGTRIARGHDGKTYKVDRNMSYKEWYAKYVEGNPDALLAEKKIKNKAKDKKQFESYKAALGKNAPASLEEFLDIKYNKAKQWDFYKSSYRYVNHIRSDKQSKQVMVGRQNKHIQNTNEYMQEVKKYKELGQFGPSIVNLSIDEIQNLVNEYAGTGSIIVKNNKVTNTERIVLDTDEFGIIVNNLTGDKQKTSVFKIHYATKGVHIVPDYMRDYDGKI